MASLFSLQPRDDTVLSKFERYGSDLPHAGSMQDFIDPSLGGGEGLELEPSEDLFDPRDLGRTAEGEYYSTATGTKFGTTPQFAQEFGAPSATAPQRNAITGATSQQQQTNPLQAAQSAIGGVGNIGSAISKFGSLFGQGEKADTEGVSLTGQETDWTSPEAVGSWLAKNPDSQVNLWAQEFNQTPEDISRMMVESGAFNLGTTGLDASFLEDFEKAQSPTTGAISGRDIATGAGIAGSATAGLSSILGAFNAVGLGSKEAEVTAKALGGVSNVAKLIELAGSGQLGTFAGGAEGVAAVLKLVSTVADMPNLAGPAQAIGTALQLYNSIAGTTSGAAPYVAAVAALAQIAMIAAGEGSDEDKAAAAAAAAVKAVGAMAAPFTFGASMAVAQIVDFIMMVRAGVEPGEALVKANDPTAMLDVSGGGGLSGMIFDPSWEWQHFGRKLKGTLAGESTALKTLADILPYVESQEQLANVIADFKTKVYQSGVGGYGEGSGPFEIPNLPGATGTKHELGQKINFDSPIAQLQALINQMQQRLPATGGRDARSLSNTLGRYKQATTDVARSGVGATAPPQMLVRMPDGTFTVVTNEEFSPDMVVAESVFYGDPRYNYEKSGTPPPGWDPRTTFTPNIPAPYQAPTLLSQFSPEEIQQAMWQQSFSAP